jgi:cytohesin
VKLFTYAGRTVGGRTTTARKNRILNNIFVDNGVTIDYSDSENWSDYNLFGGSKGKFDLIQWQDRTAWDAHSSQAKIIAAYDKISGRLTWHVSGKIPACPKINELGRYPLDEKIATEVVTPGLFEKIPLKPTSLRLFRDNDHLRESSELRNMFHIAAAIGNISEIKSIISRGVNVNVRQDWSPTTALHRAVENGHVQTVALLISKGADINVKDKSGMTPIEYAIREDYNDILELLVARGAEAPSIHVAARMGDLNRVKAFLEKGIDIDVKNTQNQTPLHCAAEEGHKEVVKLLLAHGADVNAGAWYQRTAAEFAMRKDHTEIVELLISKGADISPLHFALYAKDKAKAESLIKSGADINKRTPYGTTPLHRAVKAGFRDIARLLINKGAGVNAKDNWGWTPLHGAVYGNKEMVELLITRGANVNARDGARRTPLWYAKSKRYPEIVELLKKHGAKE